MSLPYFFSENITPSETSLTLDEETSRHISMVLRMQPGQRILLTDGKGHSLETEILAAHKRHCTVNVISTKFIPRFTPLLTVAISLVKNANRFEWFIEKAAELGTAEIIPLICDRTERIKIRHDRFISISKSGMLQSRQTWLPHIHEPKSFIDVLSGSKQQQKMIAHCADGNKNNIASVFDNSAPSHLIMIGPEGDFSDTEIRLSAEMGFDGVSLGNTRLRTETAGIVAAAICRGT